MQKIQRIKSQQIYEANIAKSPIRRNTINYNVSPNRSPIRSRTPTRNVSPIRTINYSKNMNYANQQKIVVSKYISNVSPLRTR